MQLSVIILNYNVRYFLELCIQSVQQSLVGLKAEIIVVDNNSPDDSCVMIKAQFPEVRLIENKENVGFAKANNQAVAMAKGEYLCILNPDTVVSEFTFKEVLKKAASLSNLGLLGVQLVDGKGVFLPESKRHIPTPKVSLFKMLGNKFSSFAPYYVSEIKAKAEGEIPVLVGAFMFCKKKVYQQVGGFDEDYFMYGEDIDLSYKVLKEGYKNYYFGSQTIIHFKGESTLKDAKYRERFFGAMELFYQKNFKTSGIMDTVISAGIKFASQLQSSPKPLPEKSTKDIILLSENATLEKALEFKIQLPILVTTDEKALKPYIHLEGVVCILDMNFMSYSTAIQLIKSHSETSVMFRFIPKHTTFCVGSDTSASRGKVISF